MSEVPVLMNHVQSEQERTPEAIVVPQNVEILQQMTSDEFIEHRKQWLKDQLAGEYDSQMGHVGRLLERSRTQFEDSITAWEHSGSNRLELTKKKRELSEKTKETAYRVYGADTVNRYRQLQYELEFIEKIDKGTGAVEFHGEEARTVFDRIISDTPVIYDGIDREHTIPPVDRDIVETSDFKEYLSQKSFMRFDELNRHRQSEVKVRLWAGEPLRVPLANVLSAGGFESWSGRDGGSGDKEYTKRNGEHVIGRSINAIVDYAERDTALPPVEGVDAYVQPNGIVVFGVANSNHRTAAAIARGESDLWVDGSISIHLLENNIIETEQSNGKQLQAA